LRGGNGPSAHQESKLPEGSGQVQLLRAIDKGKDQSYVLHVLNQAQLSHAIFPLGEYTKPQVRQLAQRFKLPVAARPDSQDLCFLGESTYQEFLLRNAPELQKPGPILNTAGDALGQHQGLAFYTIGQRRGIGVAGPEPYYVIQKDLGRNALIVGHKADLGRDELTTGETNWIAGEAPPEPVRAQVQIRYKARQVWGRVTPLKNKRVHVKFEQPLAGITPGQAAVFYEGQRCLGGGIIE
jgi:tRNA-specific 2-thiouridylase